jgi:predicted TPR repeat methyltransferase
LTTRATEVQALQLQRIHLSSGNLIADRRFEWARDRESKGDLTGAADLLVQALELAPGYAAALFALGQVRSQLNDRAGAIAAFEAARAADPADRHGAALHLARLGVRPMEPMPEGYIRTLFDGYALAFDKALSEGLSYRAPELLFRAVAESHSAGPLKFGSVLDLGCGTGLAALPFRPHSDWLVGVDLSPGMLSQARAKGLYDRLIEADIAGFLAGEAKIKARYHFVLAADVFTYFDDLTPVFKAVAQILAPRGELAFSVETHDDDGIILSETLRYAHSQAHVRSALMEAGLRVLSLNPASTRTEKGAPVPGLIVLAQV